MITLCGSDYLVVHSDFKGTGTLATGSAFGTTLHESSRDAAGCGMDLYHGHWRLQQRRHGPLT